MKNHDPDVYSPPMTCSKSDFASIFVKYESRIFDYFLVTKQRSKIHNFEKQIYVISLFAAVQGGTFAI